MEESTTEETGGSTAFSVRWPSALVERIDELAKADRRTRNNWLEVYLARSLDADERLGRNAADRIRSLR